MVQCWSLPPTILSIEDLKFNVDGVAMDKPDLAGIGGVLSNHKGDVFFYVFEHVGITDSNEEDVLTIFEAVTIFIFHVLLMEA